VAAVDELMDDPGIIAGHPASSTGSRAAQRGGLLTRAPPSAACPAGRPRRTGRRGGAGGRLSVLHSPGPGPAEAASAVTAQRTTPGPSRLFMPPQAGWSGNLRTAAVAIGPNSRPSALQQHRPVSTEDQRVPELLDRDLRAQGQYRHRAAQSFGDLHRLLDRALLVRADREPGRPGVDLLPVRGHRDLAAYGGAGDFLFYRAVRCRARARPQRSASRVTP
jgi:hypothetical protein